MRTRPTSLASAPIDHSTVPLSLFCSVRRSFHVAGIAGSCQGRVSERRRTSAIHRAYAPRSSSVGKRSVVVLPLIVPPSAIGKMLGAGKADRELRAARVDVLRGDRSAVRLGDGLRDREAEAGAVALRVLAAVEAAEEALLGALREPRALVTHA